MDYSAVPHPAPCVLTNGGPLILLPLELVDEWRGVLPPLGASVPTGWSWGDGGISCDYDRACDPPVGEFSLDDSFGAWPLSVGAGTALVLDGECSTTALRWDDGLVIVRDVGLASDDTLLAVIGAVAARDWVDFGFEMSVSAGVAIFDSAYAGFERDDADGGVLEAELIGNYRLQIAYPRRDGRMTLLRLQGPPQGESGRRGILVR